jgi:uncharacterized protein involved in exopolysaccharide biosynthesis
MKHAAEEINLSAVLSLLYAKRYKIGKFTAIVALIVLAYCIFATPIFTGITTINPPKLTDAGTTMNQVLNGLSEIAGGGGLLNQKTDSDVAIAILKTNRVSDMVIKRFNLQKVYQQKDIEKTRKSLLGDVKFISDLKSGFIEIDVDNPDPKLAAAIANYFVVALGQAISDVANNRSQSRYQFYQAQIVKARQELGNAESAVKNFAKAHGIIAGQQAQVIAGIATQLQAQLVVYQAELHAMSLYASPENPDFQSLQAQITSIQKQLRQLNNVQSAGDNVDIPVGLAPDLAQQYANLMRELAIRDAVYRVLTNQLEANKYDYLIEQAPTPIQVIDPAQVPLYKSKPKRALIMLIAIFLGGLTSSLYYIFKNRQILIINQ